MTILYVRYVYAVLFKRLQNLLSRVLVITQNARMLLWAVCECGCNLTIDYRVYQQECRTVQCPHT